MPDQDQNQSGNQSQASSENQTGVNTDSPQTSPQSVEVTPKPEPSYGIEKLSKTYPNLEKGIEPLPKPNPSFETYTRGEIPKTVEKRDETE